MCIVNPVGHICGQWGYLWMKWRDICEQYGQLFEKWTFVKVTRQSLVT